MRHDRLDDVARSRILARPADPEAMLLAVVFFLVFFAIGLAVLVLLGDAAVLVGAVVGALLVLPPVWLLSQDRP